MEAKTASIAGDRQLAIRRLVSKLERGWTRLSCGPDGISDFEVQEERWIAALREYEAAYDMAVTR